MSSGSPANEGYYPDSCVFMETPRRSPPQFQATWRDLWLSWTCAVPRLTGFLCWALFASAGVQSLQIASSCHDHEPHQHPPTPPLVTHFLQESEHPVGPLDVVVGPHSPADRVLQVRHQLGELLRIQLLHRLGQLGHGLEGVDPTVVLPAAISWQTEPLLTFRR
jgi:hypothetical protein